MNKKLLFGLFAAASMLLVTSCSQDELDSVQSGNQAQVTFTLGLEDALGTRAISDGTKADKLVYAVYKINAQGVAEKQNVVDSDKNGQFIKNDFKSGDNVSITLAKGQKYQVAFWAQDGDCEAYNTDELTAVEVSYKAENGTDDAANNDELRDAFFKTVTFEVNGDKLINVVLKRPFAQVNLGVYNEDWEAAVASGIEIENSKVVIKNVANKINLLTGEVEGEETITYDLNAIPEETLYVETDDTNEGKEAYKWLSMSYILVADKDNTPIEGVLGANKATLQELQYTFDPKDGNNITFNEGLNNVPVQRNWRTNILGKILTGDIEFNITIDPVYDGDYIFPEISGSVEELELAASFGGTVNLTEDVAMPKERPFLQVSADFILNIDEDATLTSGSAEHYGLIVTNGTTTIKGDGDIKSQGGGIGIVNGATVNFNGGNLDINTTSTSGRYLFYLEGEGSTLTITEGNFDFNKTQNQKRAYIYAGAGTTAYVKGGTFGKASTRSGYTAGILGEGTVIITGGTFGFDPTTWVPTGYRATKIGDKWHVAAEDVVVAANLEDVKDVFANGGKVQLVNDVKFEKITPIEPGKEVYLDLNGKTITVEETTASNTLIWVKDGAKLTIDGNGTIDLGDVSTMAIFCPYGELVINNGTFIRNKVTNVTDATTGLFMGAKNSGCNVTINGGYFDGGYYDTNAADIEEILAGTATFTETADDIAKQGKPGDANLVRVAVKDNVSVLLNHSGYGSFKVYGGTFVGANPAWGDEGCMLPTTPNYLRPWSYYQGALLDGQTFNENGIVLPAGYNITKTVNAENVPVYTVEYNK
ncbi:MAG: hypothetical protein E7089_08770 [Bacteroidales bacterium]|nr:hypothetical protein [Bacteroidales bacterium]